MSPEQTKELRTLTRLGVKRQRLQQQTAEVTAELFGRVLAADALKIPRREIAAAAQVSPQTVYNVLDRREEEPSNGEG